MNICDSEKRIMELIRQNPGVNYDRQLKAIIDTYADCDDEEEEYGYTEAIAMATLEDLIETERRIEELVSRKRAEYYAILREQQRIRALKASIIKKIEEIKQRNKLIMKRYGFKIF